VIKIFVLKIFVLKIFVLKKIPNLDTDVVWGVDQDGKVFFRDGILGRWENVEGKLVHVEIGKLGVFGVNAANEVFYRVGTRNNPGRTGTHWQLYDFFYQILSIYFVDRAMTPFF